MNSIWAVVPAAGSGRRLGGEIPKQYREIAGAPYWNIPCVRCSRARISVASQWRWIRLIGEPTPSIVWQMCECRPYRVARSARIR